MIYKGMGEKSPRGAESAYPQCVGEEADVEEGFHHLLANPRKSLI